MDITQLILDDHAEMRRLFAAIEEIGASDREALEAVWNRLKNLLDVHAEAEERFLYPELLDLGHGGTDAPSAKEETRDAIEDHNDIRDTGEAVQEHAVGTPEWFAAVDACNVANSGHMAEEERQGLTDYRKFATHEQRHELAVKFLSFSSRYMMGIKVVDKDVEAYLDSPEDLEPQAS